MVTRVAVADDMPRVRLPQSIEMLAVGNNFEVHHLEERLTTIEEAGGHDAHTSMSRPRAIWGSCIRCSRG